METRIGSDSFMVGAMYAPFCRTEYADASQWDHDLKTMREMGYTCLHGFSEWWRVEKQKGVFDFGETDRLIECARANGLVPIINVATQNGVGYYMPRWMMEEYRGTGMVNLEGKARNAVASEYPSACMDDPWYQVYAQRYLRALATHYAGDMRVGGWVIWGEPTLSFEGKPICYCPHTIRRFRSWLREKYGGDIERLNEAWGREGPAQHADFELVNPPIGQSGQRGSYASWADFRNFMDANLAGHIRQADRLFKECGATQPTIAELFCYVGNANVWQLSKSADIVGVSNFLRPGFETELVMTVANSIAKPQGKSIFVVEALGGPRYPNYDKRTPGGREIVSEAAQMIGSGAKGLMYWCYRPRLSDYEGGTFGMCRVDGEPLPRAREAGRFAEACRQASDLLHALEWRSQVAVFSSRTIEHLAPADALSEVYAHATQGAMRALLDLHVTPQLIDEEWIRAGRLHDFKALILPCAYMLDEDVIEEIAAFARQGGLVIADQGLATKRANGTVHRSWPGGKLRELFGLSKRDILYLDDPSLIPETGQAVALNSCIDLVRCEGASERLRFADWPLCTTHAYGGGAGTYLVWQAFAGYRQRAQRALRDLLADLLAGVGVKPFLRLPELDLRDEPRVVASVLYGAGGERVYTLVNPSYEPLEVCARIEGASAAEGLLDTAPVRARLLADELRVEMSLGAWESAMFRVRP